MRIVFMTGGQREKALQFLLKNSINIVALVTPYPKKNSKFLKSISIAQDNRLNIINVNKTDIYDQVSKISFDILISCGFPYKIDKKTIKLPKIIAINVHPTLLPKYRGYMSGPYILINGEKESGVTIHKLEEQLDKGDIISQKKFEVTPFDTTKSVYRKAREIEPELLYNSIISIKKGTIKLKKQNDKNSSEYSYIRTPKDSLIDQNKSLIDLYNSIRACDYNEYPAFFYVEGEKVLVKLSREKKDDPFNDLI